MMLFLILAAPCGRNRRRHPKSNRPRQRQPGKEPPNTHEECQVLVPANTARDRSRFHRRQACMNIAMRVNNLRHAGTCRTGEPSTGLGST